MGWEYINSWKGIKTDFKEVKAYESIFFFHHKQFPTINFQAKYTRFETSDRLLTSMVDNAGNLLSFDRLSIKKIAQMLNESVNRKFRHTIVYSDQHNFHILKKRIISPSFRQSPNEAEKTCLVSFRDFLDSHTSNIFAICKFLGLRTIDIKEKQRKLQQRIKKQQMELKNSLHQFLKMCPENTQSVKQQILQINKNNLSSQNSLISDKDMKIPSELKIELSSVITDYSQAQTRDEEGQKNIFQILELQLSSDQPEKILKGGSSKVEIKKVQLLRFHETSTIKTKQNILLAMKYPKQSEFKQMVGESLDEKEIMKANERNEEYQYRFNREVKMIHLIGKTAGKKRYLINYYQSQKFPKKLFMDHFHLSLHQFLYYYSESLQTSDIINLCKQLILIILDLHECGVVYRDLKPSNLIVDFSKSLKLKIIDFSDSYIKDSENDISKLCGTVPYSPLETSRNSIFYEEFGVNRKQIDYWSVGVILYEIFYGILPFTYTPRLAKDIHDLWRKQYLYTIQQQQKKGLKIIQSVFQIFHLLMIRVNQQQRMDLTRAYLILSLCEKYCSELEQTFYQFIQNQNEC